MSVIHRITGYNKRTDRLEVEYGIPQDRFTEIREVARIPSHDTDAAGSYPLDAEAARAIAWKIDKTINLDGYDCFLEPFSEA